MTMLRPSLWLPSVFRDRGTPLLAACAAVVGTGLLLPAAVAAAPHSHARRPLPTPLHTSAVSAGGSHAGSRRHKGGGKTNPAERPAAASTGGGRRGKKGRERRSRQPDPVEPLVPMYRARRNSAPLGPATDSASGNGQSASGNGQIARRNGHALRHHGPFLAEPAPLVSSSRHHGAGRRTGPIVVGYAPAHPLIDSTLPARPTLAAHHAAPPLHPKSSADAPFHQQSLATVAANQPDAFAEGVSHPEDDERLPRDRAALGEDAPVSPAPGPRVSAAPSAPSAATPLTRPTVVQGFGPEIAVPSPATSDRPGGTRRRNHPSTWQPQSLLTAPEPLEEREAITYAAVSPAVLPEIYDSNGRLVMRAPLKGSHDVLVHQNVMATSDGLERIYDDADLERLRAAHQLVSFPLSESLRVNEDLPPNRRVARPWTVLFAADAAHAFYGRFHQPLQVNSAARTVRYQARLQMVNGNAAAISGDAASPHLTGQAIDFGKRGMTQAELAWMRGYLMPLMQGGKIDVEEEFQQACFHISVYRSYTLGRRSERQVAQVHAASAETSAVPSPPEDR